MRFSLILLLVCTEVSAQESALPRELLQSGPDLRAAAARLATASQQLGMPADFIRRAARGMELVFERDYRGARTHWAALQSDYPGSAVENVGRLLIYQSLMLENFDYRFEKQYLAHSEMALEDIRAAMAVPGQEGWEHFLLGGVMGLQGIHLMRKRQYVASLNRGLEALEALKALKEIAPDFADPRVGEGIYKYWRTVVSRKTRLIPDRGDQREEGIADILFAEEHATFVGPAASLAMVYVRLEERNVRSALSYGRKNQRRFPDNVINNMLVARMLIHLRRYDQSLAVLDSILRTDIDNHRAHFHRATALMKKEDLEEAMTAIDRYLGMPLEEASRASGLHRKGDIHFEAGRHAQARGFYEQAVAINGYRPSRAKLERLRELQGESH